MAQDVFISVTLSQRVEFRLIRAELFDDAMRADSEAVVALFELKLAAGIEDHCIRCGQKENHRAAHVYLLPQGNHVDPMSPLLRIDGSGWNTRIPETFRYANFERDAR